MSQVLNERAGDIVVHVKYTVLLLPSGTVRVTGLPFPLEAIRSEKVRGGTGWPHSQEGRGVVVASWGDLCSSPVGGAGKELNEAGLVDRFNGASHLSKPCPWT
jgi:hypothetical protein